MEKLKALELENTKVIRIYLFVGLAFYVDENTVHCIQQIFDGTCNVSAKATTRIVVN